MDLLLGAHPAVFAAGELRELWERGLLAEGHCGCRRLVGTCPFWSAVGERAFGGWERLDVREVVGMRGSLDAGRVAPFISSARIERDRSGRARAYVEILGKLVGAIRDVSGADVIADSSKAPSHALLLERVPGVDLRMVHLVRDSRGVAYSWQRGFREREGSMGSKRVALEGVSDAAPAGGAGRPRRLGVVPASARWFAFNVYASSLASNGRAYLRVRYEDLVADPRETLARILEHAGVEVDGGDLSFIEGSTARIDGNHTVYGSNRLRFREGDIALRLDDEWRRSFGAAGRLSTTALTFPLLLRYGYGLGGRGPRPRAAPVAR